MSATEGYRLSRVPLHYILLRDICLGGGTSCIGDVYVIACLLALKGGEKQHLVSTLCTSVLILRTLGNCIPNGYLCYTIFCESANFSCVKEACH